MKTHATPCNARYLKRYTETPLYNIHTDENLQLANCLPTLKVHCGYWPKYCQGEWDSALAMEKAMEVLIIMYNKLRGIDHSDPWWKPGDKFKDWNKNMLMKGEVSV